MTNNPTPKKMAKPKTLEKAIETQILTYLRYLGIFAWKNESQGTYDVKRGVYRRPANSFRIKGVADIIGIWQRRPLFIEVKSSTGRLSDEQNEFLMRARNEGAYTLVARRVEDVEKFLYDHQELKLGGV